MERRIRAAQLTAFRCRLWEEERGPATIEKYLRDVSGFAAWIGREMVTKKIVTRWKEQLAASGCQAVTVNGKISAVNKFFAFLGWADCRVKYLKIQRRMFRNTERELTKDEYTRLVETAQSLGRERLSLLIETICATGIRVSEV